MHSLSLTKLAQTTNVEHKQGSCFTNKSGSASNYIEHGVDVWADEKRAQP